MRLYGELLIFILLFITNGRIIIVKERKDTLVVLAPVTLLLSVFQILAWGVSIYNVYAFILSFLVFFSNIHGMSRYSSHLYVDHYSVMMKIGASFTIILSIIGLVTLIHFAPVEKSSEKLLVTETTTRYEGSFTYGFTEARSYMPSTLTITEFTKLPDIKNPRNVVVFIPDKRGDTQNYKPFLQYLAQSGFRVCSADFYAKDCKWTHNILDNKLVRSKALTISSLVNNQKFMSQREYYTYNTSLECKALMKLLTEKYGEQVRFFFITDVMANTAVADLKKAEPEKIKGHFYLDSLEEYNTPGYGFIQQTNPILAYYMGFKRDTDGSNVKQVVQKTREVLLKAGL